MPKVAIRTFVPVAPVYCAVLAKNEEELKDFMQSRHSLMDTTSKFEGLHMRHSRSQIDNLNCVEFIH